MQDLLDNLELLIEEGTLESSPSTAHEGLEALVAAIAADPTGDLAGGDYLTADAVQFWADLERAASLAKAVCAHLGR